MYKLIEMKTENIYIQPLKREITFHIGKKQSENFEVIDKVKSDDLWFHVEDFPSGHVLIKERFDTKTNLKRRRSFSSKILFTSKILFALTISTFLTSSKNVGRSPKYTQ